MHVQEVLKKYNKAVHCEKTWEYEDPATNEWTKLLLLENYELEDLRKVWQGAWISITLYHYISSQHCF